MRVRLVNSDMSNPILLGVRVDVQGVIGAHPAQVLEVVQQLLDSVRHVRIYIHIYVSMFIRCIQNV